MFKDIINEFKKQIDSVTEVVGIDYQLQKKTSDIILDIANQFECNGLDLFNTVQRYETVCKLTEDEKKKLAAFKKYLMDSLEDYDYSVDEYLKENDRDDDEFSYTLAWLQQLIGEYIMKGD